jgi:NitT/TauT family transport system ATP-binding protein
VRQNLEFILPEEIERDERNTLIDHHLGLVGLHDFDHYYPSQLSGGMRQRVAIARAFIFPADIILMDEPFQALDLRIKLSLLTVFKRLWMETEEVQHDKTALFVTHDVQEAILLGDRIVVLSERPARVRKKLVNTVARSERSLENEKILKMERDLYTLVT